MRRGLTPTAPGAHPWTGAHPWAGAHAPLTADQRARMFVAEVLGGDAAALTPELAARLNRLDLLAPGDFAAVKRQFLLFDERPDPAAFVEQLEREHGAKPDARYARQMGFVR